MKEELITTSMGNFRQNKKSVSFLESFLKKELNIIFEAATEMSADPDSAEPSQDSSDDGTSDTPTDTDSSSDAMAMNAGGSGSAEGSDPNAIDTGSDSMDSGSMGGGGGLSSSGGGGGGPGFAGEFGGTDPSGTEASNEPEVDPKEKSSEDQEKPEDPIEDLFSKSETLATQINDVPTILKFIKAETQKNFNAADQKQLLIQKLLTTKNSTVRDAALRMQEFINIQEILNRKNQMTTGTKKLTEHSGMTNAFVRVMIENLVTSKIAKLKENDSASFADIADVVSSKHQQFQSTSTSNSNINIDAGRHLKLLAEQDAIAFEMQIRKHLKLQDPNTMESSVQAKYLEAAQLFQAAFAAAVVDMVSAVKDLPKQEEAEK